MLLSPTIHCSPGGRTIHPLKVPGDLQDFLQKDYTSLNHTKQAKEMWVEVIHATFE